MMSIPKNFRTEGPWRHPGGKLLRSGPETLTEAELLAIIISAGTPQKPAEKIAEEIIEKFHSFRGVAEQPVQELMKIKGLGQVKLLLLRLSLTSSKLPKSKLQRIQRG